MRSRGASCDITPRRRWRVEPRSNRVLWQRDPALPPAPLEQIFTTARRATDDWRRELSLRYCPTCERWAVLDLERLISEGRGDYRFRRPHAPV
jgi:hypothetical protein